MARWIDYNVDERKALIANVVNVKNIEESAAEKDWWVTVILFAIFQTSIQDYALFKGGTSLSKCWNIINRFSEDVDIVLDRSFFLNVKRLSCAKCENNTQIRNLRKRSQDFIFGEFKSELLYILNKIGLEGVRILSENEIPDENGGFKTVDHDKEPSILFVIYPSLYQLNNSYATPDVKIEISCTSMVEPFEKKLISSLVQQVNAPQYGPDIDKDFTQEINAISPARTFLEKAFLLCEEFQKDNPRTLRMSRHLYDLEKLSQTKYMNMALSNIKHYMAIVRHRERFYHPSYVDYTKLHPNEITFIPPKNIIDAFRRDYNDMCSSFIYEKNPLSFEELINKITKIQNSFRKIDVEAGFIK
jgi:hypothetical protein